MLDARPLTITDLEAVRNHLHRYPPEISELTFTNLFVWKSARTVYLSMAGDDLVFLVDAPGDDGRKVLFGPPAGPRPVETVLREIREDLAGAVRIPASLRNVFAKAGLELVPDRDNADYLYRVSDLAELAGRKYSKKRNQVKQCLDRYECRYEAIGENNLEECMAMQDAWCAIRACREDPGLCGEYAAIRDTFALYREFGLLGGAIRIEGRIRAFAIAEELSPGTAVWHFEKALPDFQGLGQLINHWFARYGLGDFEFVNREQDLGIPGLRQAKESYYQERLVEKCCSPHLLHLHAGLNEQVCV